MIQKKKFSDAIAANISVVGELIGEATTDKAGLMSKISFIKSTSYEILLSGTDKKFIKLFNIGLYWTGVFYLRYGSIDSAINPEAIISINNRSQGSLNLINSSIKMRDTPVNIYAKKLGNNSVDLYVKLENYSYPSAHLSLIYSPNEENKFTMHMSEDMSVEETELTKFEY